MLLMLLMLVMLLMEQVMVSMMVVIVRTLMLVSDTSHKQEAAQCHSTLHLVMVTEHLDPCYRANILVHQLKSIRFLLLIIGQVSIGPDSTLL